MKNNSWAIPFAAASAGSPLQGAGYGPLLTEALALHGVKTRAEAEVFLSSGADLLHDPMLMLDMDKAAERIHRAVKNGECTAVFGDYDADGITSTCIMVDYLRSKGLTCIPYIPDRLRDGYGLNKTALRLLRDKGVELLISVDCGISAIEEVDYARSIGMDVIITDHHECRRDGVVPNAVAVIDCKRSGDNYPNKNLAGVGVALKVICACEGDWERVIEHYCDYVAVGTVADVMPLVGENRCLVCKGLDKLNYDPNPGFASLITASGIKPSAEIGAGDIGFRIGPRINAAGRMYQADLARELFMCIDRSRSAALAERLCLLNQERKNVQDSITAQAFEMLEGQSPDAPIVLSCEGWQQGVIGIVASKVAEKFGLPAVMISMDGENGKGSCRSYGDFNLYEALSACSSYLTGFGGHAKAAGLTIKRENVGPFRDAMAKYYKEKNPMRPPSTICDMFICRPSALSVRNVDELKLLEPCGEGNERPLMCMLDLRVDDFSNTNGGHLRLRLSYGSFRIDGIFFNHISTDFNLHHGDYIDLAFNPEINRYMGTTSVQLNVTSLRKHEPLELCREILKGNGGAARAAARYCPERRDFARIWTYFGPDFTLGGSAEEIISQCPCGMAPEKFCICIMAFLETGLLKSPDGGIFHASPAKIEGKADLEGSHIMQTLRAILEIR